MGLLSALAIPPALAEDGPMAIVPLPPPLPKTPLPAQQAGPVAQRPPAVTGRPGATSPTRAAQSKAVPVPAKPGVKTAQSGKNAAPTSAAARQRADRTRVATRGERHRQRIAGRVAHSGTQVSVAPSPPYQNSYRGEQPYGAVLPGPQIASAAPPPLAPPPYGYYPGAAPGFGAPYGYPWGRGPGYWR
ncbi:MAG: hypothetical protein JO038_02050 [Alphaproteobacteria bacterium]|nr:hypothetical protein [Alphaproteobacteria bacterium]